MSHVPRLARSIPQASTRDREGEGAVERGNCARNTLSAPQGCQRQFRGSCVFAQGEGVGKEPAAAFGFLQMTVPKATLQFSVMRACACAHAGDVYSDRDRHPGMPSKLSTKDLRS